MLCNSGGKPEKELYYLDMLRQNKVAGIVGITYNDIENSVSNDIPIVSIDRHFNKKITCVTSDNYEGGRLALRELVKVGAQKPAFMGSVTSVFSETMNRRKGFIHEAQTLGVDYVIYEKPDPIVDDDAYFNEFLNEHRDVDGIFAITDMLAASYIERARRGGHSRSRGCKGYRLRRDSGSSLFSSDIVYNQAASGGDGTYDNQIAL